VNAQKRGFAANTGVPFIQIVGPEEIHPDPYRLYGHNWQTAIAHTTDCPCGDSASLQQAWARLTRKPGVCVVTAGPGLRASVSNPEADEFYQDILQLEKRAGLLPGLKNQDRLRTVLDKYNQLIRKYPSSNKIDDAAFQAAGIYEHFKDYSIALVYYQRAYQWDPDTIHPARFRAARILDQYLRRRAEALKLYQQAVKEESEFDEWRNNIIVINGFSKTYSMTGYRLGYTIANSDVSKGILKILQASTTCPVNFCQWGAISAIKHREEARKIINQLFPRRRALLLEEVSKTPGMTLSSIDGAFYGFIKYEFTDKPSEEVAKDILMNANVTVIPGAAFGNSAEGYIRVTFSRSEEEIKEAFHRIREYLRS